MDIPEHVISTIDVNHPNNVERKCYEMFNTWLKTAKTRCWCQFLRSLKEVGLHNVAEEAKLHLKFNKKIIPYTSTDANEGTLKENDLEQLMNFLKYVPENKMNHFITYIFPVESATLNRIKDILKCSDRSNNDAIKEICKQFLNEKESSWSKFCKALRCIECYELADLVEECCMK